MKKIIYILAVSAILIGLGFVLRFIVGNNDLSQEKYLNYKNHKICYELITKRNATKTLVFIHGWSSSSAVWKHQYNAFKDYKLIVIDLPGHGKSSKNIDLDYNIELFANSVSAVLKNENISEAFIFGHSMGFTVAEVFALKYPNLTVGIGSIDGAHFEVEADEQSQIEWIAYNNMMAETLNEESGREEFINYLFLPNTPSELIKSVIDESKNTPLPIAKKIMLSMSDDMSFWRKRVMEIPCFVVHAPVYQLTAEYKQDFLKMYPKAEYNEIDNVSHFIMLEKPVLLNKMMLDYLGKVY